MRVETCCQTGIVKRQTVHGQLLAARPVVTCYMAEHPIMQLSFRGPYRRLMVTARNVGTGMQREKAVTVFHFHITQVVGW